MTFVYNLVIICTPLNACSTTTFNLLNSVPTCTTLKSVRSFGGLHKSKMAYTRFAHKTAGHHCRVCGKNATRKSFGCYACTDCSLSFRNDVQYNLADSYKCANNGICFNDATLWANCNRCRFERCLYAGMQKDMVRRGNPLFSTEVLVEDLKQNIDRGEMEQNHRVIQTIHQAFEQIQLSTPIPLEHCHQEWKNATEIISAYYESFIKFITRVPGFSKLRLNDQCVLSKGSILEVICLSMVSYYDSGTQTITLRNGKRLGRQRSGHNDATYSLLVSSFISFMEIYSEINLSRTEMALLAALLTLVELRRGLQEPDRVAETRCTVYNALITYLNSSQYESKFGRYRYILTNVYGLLHMSEQLKSEFRQLSNKYQAPYFMQDLLDSSEHKIGIFSQRLSACQTPKASAVLQKRSSRDRLKNHRQGFKPNRNQNSNLNYPPLNHYITCNSAQMQFLNPKLPTFHANDPQHPTIPSQSGTMSHLSSYINQLAYPAYIYFPPTQPPFLSQPPPQNPPLPSGTPHPTNYPQLPVEPPPQHPPLPSGTSHPTNHPPLPVEPTPQHPPLPSGTSHPTNHPPLPVEPPPQHPSLPSGTHPTNHPVEPTPQHPPLPSGTSHPTNHPPLPVEPPPQHPSLPSGTHPTNHPPLPVEPPPQKPPLPSDTPPDALSP